MTIRVYLFLLLVLCLFDFIQAQPEDIRIRALDFSYREQWDSAIACYNRMPIKSSTFYFDRGMCYHLNTQFKEAASDFSTNILNNPKAADGWLLLAESSLYVGDYSTTIVAAKTFSAMEPKNSAAKFIQGCALLYTNKKHAALRCFNQANRYDVNADWPKVYLVKVFNKSINEVNSPSCLLEYELSGNVFYPVNSYEQWIFDWHCIHINEVKQP